MPPARPTLAARPPAAAADVAAMIGNTPVVELTRVSPRAHVRLFAKLEGANPTGSVKDRVAHAMLRAARASGALAEGQTILEASSGNTGISLAILAGRHGHPVRVVLPETTTEERVAMLRGAGAELVFSPGAEGSNGAIRLARQLAAADPTLYAPDQYANPANPAIHEETTGPELLDQVPDLDVFVAGLGTGGTLTGVGRFLRRARPQARIVAAEPFPGEGVQGLRSLDEGFVPAILDLSVIDDKRLVGHREAVVATRRLLRDEGIFAGLSSGAALHVALRVAEEATAPLTIVVLLADGGWKYLSLDLWSGELNAVSDALEDTVAW